MSDRSSEQKKPERSRVLKSHQIAGASFAFPQLEQVVDRDLPPSLSTGTLPDLVLAGAMMSRTKNQEVERRLAEAHEVQERARALERRAAAFLAEAEETANARLTVAEEQIEEMLATTAAAIDDIEAETRERAYQIGHTEGHKAGLSAAQAQADALLQAARQEANGIAAAARTAAEQVRTNANRDRDQLLESAQLQVLDLAFAVARQILKAEVTLRPEAVLPMLAVALAKMKGEEEPQVRVNTQVLALLEEHRGRLMAAVPGIRRLGLEADASLEAGDFVVQGAHGLVDGRLEQQVRVLAGATRDEER